MKNVPLIILLLFYMTNGFGQLTGLDQYHIVWDQQSRDASESMPCGGGDIGLNVWVENGELLFYIARSGTFDENNAMPKLGRVRVKLSPNPLEGTNFRQELDLTEGSVKISGQNGNRSADILLWVDVFAPVIHLEISSNLPVKAEATYENWRFQDKLLQKNEGFGTSYKWVLPEGLMTKKDEIDFVENAVLFYHHNQGKTVFDQTVQQQQLEAVKDQLFDPLHQLTFGGEMRGDNFVPAGTLNGTYQSTPYRGWKLESRSPAKKHQLEIQLHTGQYPSPADWETALRQYTESPETSARERTRKWWADFWERSYIFIEENEIAESTKAWQIGRNYQLFRYMLGCNAFGQYPTKFNGGLFTYDPGFIDSTRAFSPDFRNWGGGTFTAQNQRLVYFPLFRSGDFDLLRPQLEFYTRILGNAELRSQVYWGHDGACFTEQIENFGLPNCTEYGWKRPADYDAGLMYNAWLEYQWDTALEFCLMALMLHDYRAEDISDYIPLITSCLTFFDEHYQYLAKNRGRKTLDEQGHLVLYPGSSCETYKMAYNASSTVAGLQVVTEKLLALPDHYLHEEERQKWQDFRQRIPPLSFTEFAGHRTIAPARLWERVNNTEAPQLYPVYPWGIYGIGRPDLETAVNTYRYDPDVLRFKDHISWKQYNIFAARLGLTEEAQQLSVLKLQDSGRRFPAFWGPGFDWVPDHNWGGSGMIGLQEMLVQSHGDKIYLFPAWPAEWDVRFKLHAPQDTRIEAELRNGQVNIIRVEPPARAKDIEVLINR
ncbi:DUF5703 domain-containing protein [Flavilitoribacter nigricans]|uniref:DUF5703 domain-containing protein n=1 Tax=Flavilitoribacter nigricans (strain ATCC 23147 / DSM 23189 / NBRC 102662 / NCIMB 1420 / SS-2) TaxID=1122177 RepID=A0A2D0N1N5_FLAN2|nr:DUF5703 domain-containing protein [Flavilitoribacter nigricans]PHN02424.1 hypothetical protein CRP01_32085 [Flavilitoribacter nigricans DSM 23189 = NBRC 102662]